MNRHKYIRTHHHDGASYQLGAKARYFFNVKGEHFSLSADYEEIERFNNRITSEDYILVAEYSPEVQNLFIHEYKKFKPLSPATRRFKKRQHRRRTT